MDNPVKSRIAEILDPHSKTDSLSRGFNIFITSLIVLNVIAVILETVKPLGDACPSFFQNI